VTQPAETQPAETPSATMECAVCSSVVFEDDRFCEGCGAPLTRPEAVGARASLSPPEPLQRVELDLGTVAGVSDRGHRRQRNEDALAMEASENRAVAAVCDGVASTSDAHVAAGVAASVATEVLAAALDAPEAIDADAWRGLFSRAFGEAQRAITAAVGGDAADGGPSTTMVAAIVAGGRVGIANVGDSRAYWLPGSPSTGRALTVDDSWAQGLIADGMAPDDAFADPLAQTITRWLGADVDADSVEPTMSFIEVGEPGLVVLCSDGLWNYFETPGQLVDLVHGSPEATPLAVARHLVNAALEAGGHDNVTVAVLPVTPDDLTSSPGEARPPFDPEEGQP